MASRILQASLSSQRSKVGICCSFILVAAAMSYSCPFSSAAGIMSSNHYGADGAVISSSEYNWAQSSGSLNVALLTGGQETLTGGARSQVVAVEGAEVQQDTTINANDHQVYGGVTQANIKNNGMVFSDSYLESEHAPLGSSYGETVPESTSSTIENNTTVQKPIFMPINEEVFVSKGMIGGKGMFRSETQIEQGSNETTDYLTENTAAQGTGTYLNDVNGKAEVAFNANTGEPNYILTAKQHDLVSAFNATNMFTWESFGDVFMNPANKTEVS